IGSLCYLKREASKPGRRRKSGGRNVALLSICRSRTNHIRAFIAFILDQQRYGSNTAATIHYRVKKFSKFMDWSDSAGYSNCLDNGNLTRTAIEAFVLSISEKVATHAITRNFGACEQVHTSSILSQFLEIDNLTQGLNLLRFSDAETVATAPPDESDLARILSLCEMLFGGLSEKVLDRAKYPFKIVMPSYLGYHNNIMWVFPSKLWSLPPDRQAIHLQPGANNYGAGFNYREGRLSTRAEVLEYRHGTNTVDATQRRTATQTCTKSKLHIDQANSDPVHWHRRFMGSTAINAFIPLFLARTGMNWAQLISLEWDIPYSQAVSTIRQRFRKIKFRAGGKPVHFELPLAFMPLFVRFLQVREHLLKDFPDFKGLFFTFGGVHPFVPSILKTQFGTTFNSFQRIDPTLKPVLSRGWRAAKSDWLLPRTDVATTAQVMQNSESTILKSYAAGTSERHLAEMSALLDALVMDKRISVDDEAEVAAGVCSDYGSPFVTPGLNAIVPPNCQNPDMGCLFCDKFHVHADELDVRKLLSCRYCLTATSHLSGFHSTSEQLVARLDQILARISIRDAKIVERIAREVANGELTPYWAHKYDMLLRLGLAHDFD
ncbi:MAG TPA: hypothetical protein VIE65_10885, partial [Methylobacter sp.]